MGLGASGIDLRRFGNRRGAPDGSLTTLPSSGTAIKTPDLFLAPVSCGSFSVRQLCYRRAVGLVAICSRKLVEARI
jgi:hypothetical protein